MWTTVVTTTWPPSLPKTAPGTLLFGKATGRVAFAKLAADIRARAGADRPRAAHLVTNIVIALERRRAGFAKLDGHANRLHGAKIGSGGAYVDARFHGSPLLGKRENR